MECHYRLIICILAVFVTIPVIVKNRSSSFKAATPVFYSVSPGSVLVGISGDVKHPGIYTVTATTMTVSVIKMAMPLREIKYYLPHGSEQILADSGSQYKISINTEGYAVIRKEDIPVAHRLLLKIPLNINRMNADDFERIPGIGPVMGKRIIEYRHKNGGFMKISDLLMVEGIGEKKYLQLEKYFNQLKKLE